MTSNTVANLRNEHEKTITLRSGKELVEPEQLEEVPSNEVEASKGQKYESPMNRISDEKNEGKTTALAAPSTYDPPISYSQRVRL